MSSDPPPGGTRRPEEEFSAGGVVVKGDEVLVIVPRRPAADGSEVLALPKGHADAGETPEQAASREVREEGGVDAELVDELGDVHYRYRRGGRAVPKRVTFYLFRYRSGDPANHDHEVVDARWMKLSDARQRLTYEGEREMVARALSRSPTDR
jgi:8-oxo-dGTP pyrophosphatase MutT (NUDIX family)